MAPIPYDQRDGFIWMDGALVPWRDAKTHVLTHALHYGSGVFEGARIYDTEVFALSKHSERLRKSAQTLGFEVPYSVAELDQACRDVIKAQGQVEGYIRPIAYRGAEEMGVAAKNTKIHVAIACWDWGSYFPEEERMKGIRLCFAHYRRPDPKTAPSTAKAAGLYMICTIEKHRSMDLGYNDAMMLDYRGVVAEATGANIFFVKDGALHTPAPDCILNGITRQTIIALARRRGIKVSERQIQPEEMAGFEQCFLTGSAAEVTPVSEIGEYRFVPGEITKALMDDYSAFARPKTRAEKKLELVY